MNCYIIEDEQHCINYLAKYIPGIDGLKLVGSNLNALTALQEIEALGNIDFVFTDIRLNEMSGFDIVERLSKHMRVIVTTVNGQFKQTALELGAAAVLLKPFTPEALEKTMKKLMAKKPLKKR